MALKTRLKRLELNQPLKTKLIVVKFSAKINELSCGEEKFKRNDTENEQNFIKRVKAIFMNRPNRANRIILLSNF